VSNRAAWNVLALNYPYTDIFGDTRWWTGFQLFTKCNRNRQSLGLPIIEPAPLAFSVQNPGVIYLSYVAGPPERLDVITSTLPLPTEGVIIKALRPLSQGITIPPNSWKRITSYYPPPAQPWDILPAYTARFGDPTSEDKIFVTIHFVEAATGWAGADAYEGIIWP